MSSEAEASGGSEALLEVARPDLYRVNSFRVVGLPVDVTAREVAKQAERLRMLERVGGVDQSRRALPLDPPPDADAMRAAMQRLRDPEVRLIDELFWFWPQLLGQSKSDEALAAMLRGNAHAASETWVRQETTHSESGVSTHNLAVLSHALALDMEPANGAAQLSPAQIQLRDTHWKAAFLRWRALLANESFWSRLAARIRDLDDPRLTTGSARRMRASLPLALLLINAQLAVRAAEREDGNEAARHLRLMRESGYAEKAVDGALQRAVGPIRERSKTLCKAAEAEGGADLTHADRVTRRLLEHTRPLLGILDRLLPAGHSTREGAHDEVALVALACLIPYGNKTENWKVTLELIEKIQKVAASKSARDRIDENLERVKNNLTLGTCWFCQERPGVDSAACEVKMFGNVNRFLGRVTWNVRTVRVPRCAVCRQYHSAVGGGAGAGATLGLLAGMVACGLAIRAPDENWIVGLFALAVFCGGGYWIGERIGKARAPNIRTRSESAKLEYALIKDLQKQGWQLGEKPANVQ